MRRLRALREASKWYLQNPTRFRSLFARLEGEWLNLSPWTYAKRITVSIVQYRRLAKFFRQPAHPLLGEVEAASHSVLFKMLLPYQRTGLTIKQRADRLIEHYEQAMLLFGKPLFRATHINPTGFVLCHIRLSDGNEILPVLLFRHKRSWREGEMSIGLYEPSGKLIYSITFSLISDDGAAMFVGSLIGRTTPENVKRLTKLMHGLRPQSLMLFLAQSLCRYFSLRQFFAVGQHGHVFSRTSMKERLSFNYDAFWLEHGGQMLPDDPDIYRLPADPERRPEAEIPSHKRAQYRRRFAFMDDVEAELRSCLNELIQPGEEHSATE